MNDDKDLLDPQNNELIPVENGEDRSAVDLAWIEQQIEEGIGESVTLGPDLRLERNEKRGGYAVYANGATVGDLSKLSHEQLCRIRDFFKKNPKGNDLIPAD